MHVPRAREPHTVASTHNDLVSHTRAVQVCNFPVYGYEDVLPAKAVLRAKL